MSKIEFAHYVLDCFKVAHIEGIEEILADTPDCRLKDLVERRLMYVYYKASEIIQNET